MPCDELTSDTSKTGEKKDGPDEIISVARVREGGRALLDNRRALAKAGPGTILVGSSFKRG